MTQLAKVRGRPREFDETQVGAALMDQFWEHGYDGTSLSDIMRVTGLSKASLYASFGNKQAMYLHALGIYEAREVAGGVAMLGDRSVAARERLRAMMHAPADAQEAATGGRGCFLCNASADRAALDTPTSVAVRAGYERLRVAFQGVMAELGATPEQAERRAALALTSYAGMRVMARTGTEAQVLRDAAEAVLELCV